MNMRIIGIDLAVSAKHKAMVLDPACNQFIGRQMTFRARPDELDRVIARARKGAPDDVRLVAVLEATAMAWYPVATYLEEHDVEVYRVNGKKTKELRQVLWRHTGSDRIDSRVLTHLYTLAPDRLVRCPLPSGQLLALQRACRAYARWGELHTAEQNRMREWDRWAWGGSLDRLIPTEARSWMRRRWYNIWEVVEAGEEHLATAWRLASSNPQADISWIGPWVERAKQMTTLYPSPRMVGYDELQATMIHCLDLQTFYEQERRSLKTQEILPLYYHLYPDCPLTTLMGVGEVSAATYRAFIQDVDRFPSASKFRLWCGIVPSSKQSGSSEAKGLAMTKAGPNLIKATLYLNANVARQRDVQIAAIYHRQMVEYGKHHTVAVCACASHLANRIYAILKENRPYQLRDLDGNPITAKESRQLCLQLQVPDEVRQRNNKRFRRARADQKAEAKMQQRQRR